MLPRRADSRSQVRVGRYLVTGRVGRGGMGMVYRAVDEALEREVALKTLIAEGSVESEGRRRFKVEAKAAARLQHPNIVTVYELGEDRGIPYIAMEMLSGIDLEAVLRGTGEPLALAEKLDVVAQVCRGLAYAHEHGIVHRDVKPSNVRLLEDGAVKIMDFGIAKLGGTQLTKAGMMVGTVHYMSPEQVRGKPLDGRSDVFSVGVILYELLAGERPFRGEGTTQILYKIVHEDPSPLDLGPLGPLGTRLSAIVARALAKDPDERYPNASAMADDLASALEELQRSCGPPPPSALEALVEARRLLRGGEEERAIRELRTLASERPALVEARRALRSALLQQRIRLEPPALAPESYPELESTFQATQTRRELATDLVPTVAIEPERPRASVAPVTAAALLVRRWRWTASALVALALAAGSLLLWRAPAKPLRLAVRSQPTGASILVDGRDSGVTTDGTLELPAPAAKELLLTFRKAGYRDETRTLRLPLRDELVSVALQALVPLWGVRTKPEGASVTLDGRGIGTTPLELAIDGASDHRVEISLEGFAPRDLRIAKGERPAPLDLVLQPLPPPGTVVVSSSYPLDVLWRGRTLARGEPAPRVSLPGGRQALTLVAPSVFLRADVTVEVPPGGQAAVEAPGLGKLNVRALPDNCEVFVDGAFVDYPPILDRAVAAGRHLVGFRWPDGSRDQQTIVVSAGSPAFVVGQKAKE